MSYNNLKFWIWLIICIFFFFLLKFIFRKLSPRLLKHFDKIALALTSLALFYLCSGFSFLIFVGMSVLTYLLLSSVLKSPQQNQKIWLALLITVNLLILCFFKLAGYFSNLAFPVGISFYTFQMIAFSVDTIRERKEIPEPFDYLNFVSFFPFIGAGPVERRKDLLPQLQQFRYQITRENILSGMPITVLGLFYKLGISDNLLPFIHLDPTSNAYSIWWNSILYGFWVYYDFAGYSLIAMGLGRIFGIQLTLNFRAPFTARNIREFWQRWNISLTSWLRDYIYIPLGGGRVRWWPVNIFFLFLIWALWHGIGSNFVIWGILQGALVAGYRIIKNKITLPSWAAWGITYLSFSFTWPFLYETNLQSLSSKIITLFTPHSYSLSHLRDALFNSYDFGDLLPLGILLTFIVINQGIENANRNLPCPYSPLFRYWITLILILFLIIFMGDNTSPFFYFAI